MPYTSNMITLERASFELKFSIIEPYLIYDENGNIDEAAIEIWFEDKPWIDDYKLTLFGLYVVVDFNQMNFEPMPQTIRDIEELVIKCIPSVINRMS